MGKKLTNLEFINKSKLKHGDLYDYSKVDYKNINCMVIITCKNHGDFKQRPTNHLQGFGCLICTGKAKLSTEEFINKSKLKHGDVYDYSKVFYKNIMTKVIITCLNKHGDFEQTPNNHLKGTGCPKCGNKTLTIDEFINRSKIKHGNLCDYSKVVYKNIKSKIIITFKNHGDFEQTPNNHIKGSCCPKCAFMYSKVAINWIKSVQFNINKEIQNMSSPSGEYMIPTTFYKADGYCKETNTIYEFHGDIWHGNPKVFKPNDMNPVSKKTYGELYEQTQNKKKKIIELGYNYVEIWEYDWDKAIKAIVKIQKIWKKYFKKISKNQ